MLSKERVIDSDSDSENHQQKQLINTLLEENDRISLELRQAALQLEQEREEPDGETNREDAASRWTTTASMFSSVASFHEPFRTSLFTPQTILSALSAPAQPSAQPANPFVRYVPLATSAVEADSFAHTSVPFVCYVDEEQDATEQLSTKTTTTRAIRCAKEVIGVIVSKILHFVRRCNLVQCYHRTNVTSG